MKGIILAGVALLWAAPLGAQEALQTVPSASSHPQLKRDADAAYRKGDFAKTAQLASQVLSENPNDAVAYYLRGSAKIELGIQSQNAQSIREGIDDARQAIQLDSSKPANYYLPYLFGMSHLTGLEGETHHAETAVSVATEVLGRSSIDSAARANLLYQRALARTRLQEHASAADDLRQAIDADANHLAARMALGEALMRSGDLEGAEQTYAAAIEQFPQNPVVFNNRGTFFQAQKRFPDAIADFTRAVELDPSQLQAHMNRGFARLASGDYADAEGDFTHALELQPDHAPAYSLRATAALLQQKFTPALQDYLKVIELRPSFAPARADIGFAYFFAKYYDTAAQAFEQALVLSPESRFLEPWRYAALCLAGRRDAANQAFRQVAEKPADQRDWFDLLTLSLMGKIEDGDLLASIDSQNMTLRDAQLCEAHYFIGLRLQMEGKGDPDFYFRRAVDSKATQLSAYRAARIELDRRKQ